MERTYTNVGKEEATLEQIDEAVKTLNWLELSKEKSLPMAQGLAIKEVVKKCRIPKVSHIAYHGMIHGSSCPYGFYGIKAKYKNGKAVIYLLDNGCEVVIMASDFYPN